MPPSIMHTIQVPRLWQKSLTDLIKALRAHKGTEAQFLAEALTDIKEELKSDLPQVKAIAVSKLTYLHMLGYDVSFASFKVIEVMSQAKFSYKRIGYLAASQLFTDSTDVLMLTTNMLKKDILSQNQYDVGLALNCLANLVTPDLARDLANDMMAVLGSTRPYVRKKALLAMYKVVLRFPDALRPFFVRLKERLNDPDLSVQSAAVNVVCELARKNPKNYLSLAPTLYKMLGSHNNWMLIKIIKLFAALLPHEPRLGKKLVEPLTNIINTTTAMSLLYEAVSTVVEGLPNHGPAMQLCVNKLRLLIEDRDQNLKYLGLVQLAKISKAQPRAAAELKDFVLACLDDPDETIRIRAMDLLAGMASKKTLPDIVKRMLSSLEKVDSTSYRDQLIQRLLAMCAQDNYKHIASFEWLYGVLLSLVHLDNVTQGEAVANQLLDIAVRVKAVRPFAVQRMAGLITSSSVCGGEIPLDMQPVLSSAAFICGEYCLHLQDAATVLQAMATPTTPTLPSTVQMVYISNMFKIFVRLATNADSKGEAQSTGAMLLASLQTQTKSADLEVQERACMICHALELMSQSANLDEQLIGSMSALYDEELNPVAPKAQKKVPVPEGLRLDKWIHSVPSSSESELEEYEQTPATFAYGAQIAVPRKEYVEDPAEVERRRESRRQQLANNPHYLQGGEKKKPAVLLDVDAIPIQQLDLGTSIVLDDADPPKLSLGSFYDNQAIVPDSYEVAAVEELPAGAVATPIQSDNDSDAEAHQALDIDLEGQPVETSLPPARDRHRHHGKSSKPAEGATEHHRRRKASLREPAASGREKEGRQHRSKERERERDKDRASERDTERHSARRETDKPRHSRHRHRDGERHKDKSRDAARGASLIEESQAPNDSFTPGAHQHMSRRDKEKRHRRKHGHRVEDEDETSQPRESDNEKLGRASRTSMGTESRNGPVVNVGAEVRQQATAPEGQWSEGGKLNQSIPGDHGQTDLLGNLIELETNAAQPGDGDNGKDAAVSTSAAPQLYVNLDTFNDNAPGSEQLEKSRVEPQRCAKDEHREENSHIQIVPKSGELERGFVGVAQNDTLAVSYMVRRVNDDSDLALGVVITSKTDLAQPIVQLAFENSTTVRLDEDAYRASLALAPHESKELSIAVEVNSELAPCKVNGSLLCLPKQEEVDGLEGLTNELTAKDQCPHSDLQFNLTIPVSAFIVRVQLAPQELTSILTSGHLCPVQRLQVKTKLAYVPFLDLLQQHFHMTPVEQTDQLTSTYGRTGHGLHVCLLVRGLEGNEISLECKTSGPQLATSLLDEIARALSQNIC